MVSLSSVSLFEISSGSIVSSSRIPSSHGQLTIVPGTSADVDIKVSENENPEAFSPMSCRYIIVANFLPLHSEREPKSGEWSFTFDEDSLLLQMKDGFSSDTEVYFVGSLKVDVDLSEQEEVEQKLLKEYNCVPTFISPELQNKFYLGFCKQVLWDVFHYMLLPIPDFENRFEQSLWQAYVSANMIFADKVMEIANPEEDYIWIHDYHLMILPMFLRRHAHGAKLGFFLHSSFPSSEIYRALPVRDEILKSLLSCDLIGFHTYEYARHFLSCCSRIVGLDYELKRGYIELEYLGHTVSIKILPVGVHVGRLESALNHPLCLGKVHEIRERFKGKTLIISVDDVDIFKGISLKLEAVDELLQLYPNLWGKLVMIQILNPPRSTSKDFQEVKREVDMTCQRINAKYSSWDYTPVILMDHPMTPYEKTAYYALSDCCIINAVRDGMNLLPLKYIVCRQGTQRINEVLGIPDGSLRTSALVLSEFIGCSPSLSGAIRVNPLDTVAVTNAIHKAIGMSDSENQLRHEEHYQYISTHDVVYWVRSFMQHLERSCKDNCTKCYWGLGLGLNFRVLALSPNFRKISLDHIVDAYKRTSSRAIFLDYDGTIVSHSSGSETPSLRAFSVLKDLCSDPKNTVFIVSGRGKGSLSGWFSECDNLGIAAEHGYFIRWSRDSEWETSPLAIDFEWKQVAESVMRMYLETTDGSYIETKETAVVWHYEDSDFTFGLNQAKELLNHLGNVLANYPVVVKKGYYIVEVKPQGVTKGLVTQKVISTMINKGKLLDFVLCIGDDRSDEDMFASITNSATYGSFLPAAPVVFPCTVNLKPSKAMYYLEDTDEVLKVLQHLVKAGSGLNEGGGSSARTPPSSQE